LSQAEQALMDLVWQMQPVSVSDLLVEVNRKRSRPIIRNTLQTQLRRLEDKGWVLRETGGPVQVFRSTVRDKSGRIRMLTELRQRLFGGSRLSMIRCLMENDGLSRDEIKELQSIIDEHRNRKTR
jgi:predicted transcriptional regulator